MTDQFYTPDLGTEPDNPFARDADGKLVRRFFWLDMSDRTIIQAMHSRHGPKERLPGCSGEQ